MNALKYIGGTLLVVLILFAFLASPYNSIVAAQNRADREFAVIQAQLQRRADLIPNLVETVRGYAAHEERVFTEVTAMRARASQLLQIDPQELANNPALQQQLLEAQDTLSGALSRLMVVVENYPNLRATEQFQMLQAQLEGTENRITTARRDAQVAVESYNNRIEQFPGNIYAGIFGFDELAFYQATAPNAEQAPTVDFSQPTPATP